MKKLIYLSIFFLSLLSVVQADNKDMPEGWYFSTAMGLSESTDSRLKLHKDGVTGIQHANWEGRSFTDSTYYNWRFEKWAAAQGWGIEFIHHKIYLTNPATGLDHLSLSDGYNQIYYNKVVGNQSGIWRLGAGIVLGHPDVKFTNEEKFHRRGGIANSGFFVVGPSAQLAFERWIGQSSKHYLSWESKLTLSYAKFRISDNQDDWGEDINIAIHFLLNIGSKPMTKDNRNWTDYAKYFVTGYYPYTSGLIIEALD